MLHAPDEIRAPAPRSSPAASATDILRFLTAGLAEGRRGLLAAITGLSGTGARAVGSYMAVLDNGDSAGSFSSGCVETAIVAEALDVLTAGAPRTVRFGQGSPYIDIRLPCGGGMDVHFLPDPPRESLEAGLASLDARHPVIFHLDPAGSLSAATGYSQRGARWEQGIFSIGHAPPLRLVLLGHGAEMLTTLHLARSFGALVEIYSPDVQIVEAGRAAGAPATRLVSQSAPPSLAGDPWTAFLFLFHDHDWEPPLLARALEASSFWIGAMGSRQTQSARGEALKTLGVDPAAIARVHGPIGLIPHTRDPATLGLSALAEIVGAYNRMRQQPI